MIQSLSIMNFLLVLDFCSPYSNISFHDRLSSRSRIGLNPNRTCRQLTLGYESPITLSSFLNQANLDPQLTGLLNACASACADISSLISRLPIEHLNERKGGIMNIQGEEQKAMDVISNEIFKERVAKFVAALASEEEENIIIGGSSTYEIAFDPLDGSSNLDVSIATGSIFAISPFMSYDKCFTTSGRSIVASGYSVYSSCTELVLSLGPSGAQGAHGFTLDPISREWILTRPRISCPDHGGYYSLNESREPDWPDGLRRWIYDARRGETPSRIIFSSRYICSLCADVHRTLIKGGWAGNPRPHLRLLYEGGPLAHIAEACGGRGSDGTQNLLDVIPKSLHHRTSVFIGSINDIIELESYGDLQQNGKQYQR